MDRLCRMIPAACFIFIIYQLFTSVFDDFLVFPSSVIELFLLIMVPAVIVSINVDTVKEWLVLNDYKLEVAEDAEITEKDVNHLRPFTLFVLLFMKKEVLPWLCFM